MTKQTLALFLLMSALALLGMHFAVVEGRELCEVRMEAER